MSAKVTRFAEGSYDVVCDFCDWHLEDVETADEAVSRADDHLLVEHQWFR